MRTNRLTRLTAGSAGLALLLGMGSSGPVWAKDGADDARARGACSRSADWELRAKPRDGRLEVRFDVDANRPGQQWIYTIRRDGTLTSSGKRTTNSSSASFRVQRTLPDVPGTSRITATARNPKTREHCRAAVTI
ncbi:MAG TPA: hypothetical protein VLQ92_04045 [Candidatus Limnocylindrales bacterium]|nr:hypothetical protein [Candidatus Limnocylindrales bacterium]